jgi:hypothetical protein
MENHSEYFGTVFINKTARLLLIEDRELPIFQLGPGQEFALKSWTSKTEWSRWSKVVFLDGSVDLTENQAWSNPWSFPFIELKNMDGAPEEFVRINSPEAGLKDHVVAKRGIPSIWPIDIEDPWAMHKSVCWKKVTKLLPDEQRPGFFVERTFVEKTFQPRPKSEHDRIIKLREDLIRRREEAGLRDNLRRGLE